LPRYIERPEVEAATSTGVAPVIVDGGYDAIMWPASAAAVAETPALARVALAGRTDRAAPSKSRMIAESAPPRVSERALGDLFVYEVEHPVTVPRDQSALVPIVLKPFEERAVLLYNKVNRAQNPLRCVEFFNTTGLTLEGGPVTVLEGGDYVGEAMLETLTPDETRLTPFAVELSVRATDNLGGRESRFSGYVIRQGTLTTHRSEFQSTTYTFRNNSAKKHTLYLEHPHDDSDWQLVDTPDPFELTDRIWRFRFPLPPSVTTQFVVNQRRSRQTTTMLSSIDDGQIRVLFDQREFDAAAKKAIAELIAIRAAVARHDEQLQALQRERTAIHEDQKRSRENLLALGDRPSEKGLRERYMRGLEAQEDRLIQIDRDEAEALVNKRAGAASLNQKLAALDFEAFS
jgi:hypothetical protein